MSRGRSGTPPWAAGPSAHRRERPAVPALPGAAAPPAAPARTPVRLRPAAGPEAGKETVRPTSRLWHVTLSLAGAAAPLPAVRRALERLAEDHSFLLTSRYATDHAEVRYWEQARDLHDAAAIALRLWGEHRSTAKLPPWEIVGLEVIDRETWRQRLAEGYGPPPAGPLSVRPY